MSIYTGAFWRDTGERVVSSAAQGFLNGTGLGATAEATGIIEANVTGLPWLAGGSSAVGMAILTLCKCIIAVRSNPESGASFAKNTVQLTPEQDMVRPHRKPRKQT